MSNERLVMVSVTTLESLISMARSHVEDIESGVEEGIYQASENQDVGGKKSAIELAEGALLEGLNESNGVVEALSLVYETYVCSLADGMVEWGYCFKRPGSDDVEFDLVIAGSKSDDTTDARMQADFARLEWAAKAVCAAPGHSAALAKVDQAFDGLNSLLDSSGALEAEGTQRAVYTLRLAIAEALGDELRISAARETLEEIDLDDVAEWVGLHYGRNFECESEEKRKEWVARYAEAHGLPQLTTPGVDEITLPELMMNALDRLANGESFNSVVKGTGITARVAEAIRSQ